MPFRPIDPKPDFSKLEEEILKFWEDSRIFEKSLENTRDGKPFTFYDGPPFATGVPHYGHILASTIKDVIPRFQTMKGRFVRRRWGWDCHGLPIEEIVERKLGISGKKQIEEIGIKKFNETCRLTVLRYVAEWRKTVRRIARWIDFDNSYKTMDRDYMESVWWAFKQIYDQGLVYEGRKVLLYCPRCETPVSNFEVAMDNSYETVREEAVTVKFKIKNPKFKGTYLLAWTTTPWTLIGNVALAVGKDIDYVKAKVGDEFYILAKDRLSAVIPDAMEGDPESKKEILNQVQDDKILKGKDLVGLEYEPLFDVPAVESDKTYKVYPADFVTTEEGTGIVHTAVVYGEDDYNLGLKVGLPVVPLLDEKGKFNEKSPTLVRGMYFKDAEKLIKEDLEKRNLMFDRRMHDHSYPHCWRCGNMLYYNAIPAWFINIQKIKKDLLKSNKKEINWHPDHLKFGRYQKSVEAAPDWNISRNRFWGNPMPVWKCADCGRVKVVGSVKELNLSRNTFYFSRHGEGRQNVLELNASWPEPDVYDLTAKGVERAKNLAKHLKKQGGVDLIFASDLLRTKHTAEIVGEILRVPVQTDKRLRELDVGKEHNGKPMKDYGNKYPFDSRWDHAPEDGETNWDVQKRMVEFVNEINQKYQGKKILVVSHGDPLWILMKYFGSELPYPTYANRFFLDVSIVDLHRPYIDDVVLKCENCGGSARRIPEIFDSWMEAGSMPFAEFHYPFDQKEIFENRMPAQFVAEYIAQTRAWFYVMHVISRVLFGKAPFENVVTTGTILAEDGSKMSKSKENFPDPWKVIDHYGVDALRFYLMNSAVMQADNLNFSERDLQNIYRRIVLIVWNVYNYFVTYANEANWEPELNSKFKIQNSKSVIDQWICARTKQLINDATSYLDGYETVKATRAMEGFVSDLSTWYLRRSRGRKDEEFFATLRHVLLNFAKVSAPVMPFLSELIYQNLNRKQEIESVHLAGWPRLEKLSRQETALLSAMEVVREAATIGMNARKQLKLPVRQPLLRLAVKLKASKVKFTPELLEILLSELNVKSVDDNLIEEAKIDNKIYGFSGTKQIEYFYLDSFVSEQLKREGLIRHLERLVQDLRKRQGLKVGEITDLFYDIKDEELTAALLLVDRNKTFVGKITNEPGVDGEEGEIEGKIVRLRLHKP